MRPTRFVLMGIALGIFVSLGIKLLVKYENNGQAADDAIPGHRLTQKQAEAGV